MSPQGDTRGREAPFWGQGFGPLRWDLLLPGRALFPPGTPQPRPQTPFLSADLPAGLQQGWAPRTKEKDSPLLGSGWSTGRPEAARRSRAGNGARFPDGGSTLHPGGTANRRGGEQAPRAAPKVTWGARRSLRPQGCSPPPPLRLWEAGALPVGPRVAALPWLGTVRAFLHSRDFTCRSPWGDLISVSPHHTGIGVSCSRDKLLQGDPDSRPTRSMQVAVRIFRWLLWGQSADP